LLLETNIFPYMKILLCLCKKDHATGRDAQTPIDMCEEIQQEKGDENQIGQNEKDELEENSEDVPYM
jgi:hypothetical protein